MLGGIRHGVLGDPQKMNLSGDFSGNCHLGSFLFVQVINSTTNSGGGRLT